MVLSVEVSSDGVCDSKEVGHVDGVRDVGVEVILEVLKHVHVFVDETISSHSWEGESVVIELPGVNVSKNWSVSGLGSNSLGDVNYVSPVSCVEGS